MKIYTRTGDKGQTSLFGGKRVLKSHVRVDAYGTVDELNSTIGVAIAELANGIHSTSSGSSKWQIAIKEELQRIQHDLLSIGASLANPSSKSPNGLEKRVDELEVLIDNLTKNLPEIKNFILPGGGKTGSLLHMSRTIARRAERRIVALVQKEDVDDSVIMYMNRLSDLLFTMARFVNKRQKKKETIWEKKQR